VEKWCFYAALAPAKISGKLRSLSSLHKAPSTMILIGQYDSPFVRRVAIALDLYGHVFEPRPWSTFGDGDKIAPYNPLRRVPTLVLDDGEALIESTAILDTLDELADRKRR
jgi:glutathione S-transferase